MNKKEVLAVLQKMQEPSDRRMRLVADDAVIEFNDITGMYVLVTERCHVIFNGYGPGPIDSNTVLLKNGKMIFARVNCHRFEVQEI